MSNKDTILEVFLEDEMSEGFINYAKELIENRSIPSVYDGLKPVQRRIIYAMYQLKMFSDSPYRKSARIVGEVLGKYHPHGDSSVYDAMVRMSQWWSMRYPFIDLQGNGGSIDGDSPAAMRYTEVRLSPIVQEFVKDLDKNCINWIDNFDSSLKEPEVLPTLLPNYLLNGGMGIAVGVSCDIPTHNLGELIDTITAYIDNPNLSTKELLKILKGPDLPTGGIIEGKNLLDIYSTGTGSFKIRAKHKIEKGNNNKQLIVITEIPFQTNKSKILSQLSQLYLEKKLSGVTDIRDESTLEDGIRIVLEVKKDVDPNYILKTIFKKTDLETTQKVNLRAVINGKLRLLSLKDYLNEYLSFQKEIMTKKIKNILEKYKYDLHLLEGYIICLADIDKVIDIIKNSRTPSSAKVSLMKEFSIDDIQAQAILDLKLSRLTSLEISEIKKRQKKLTSEVKRLQKILEADKEIFKEIKRDLIKLKDLYADKRRTKIQKNFTEIEAEKPVVEFYVVVKDKNIKIYQTKNFKFEGDILIETDNTKSLILIAQTGDFYRFGPEDIPAKVPLTIVGGFATNFENDNRILNIITKNGMIKRTFVKEYDIKRSQASAIQLNDGDEVVKAFVTDADTSLDVILITDTLDYNYFDINEVSTTGRTTKGIRAIRNKNDDIKYILFADKIKEIVLECKDNTIPLHIERLPKLTAGNRKSLSRVKENIKKLKDIQIVYKDDNQAG